jgi:DNA-binding beta-propeller fold protein YncE
MQTLFVGNNSGAEVIPYSTEFSPMMFFCNPYNDLGTIHIPPQMPYNLPALSHDQVQQLYDWITAGAPDKDGKIMFSDDPNRMKYYVVNQGCDEVAVFDAQAKVIMRYVSVGANPNQIEAPHQIRISPDGQYWYVMFLQAPLLQKFRTSDDQLVGSVQLGPSSSWFYNTMCMTSDGKFGYIISMENPGGKIAYVNLETMQFQFYIGGGPSDLYLPHGSYLTKDNKTLYVTAQSGNFIYKIDVTNPALYNISKVVLQPGQAWSQVSSLDVHEVRFTPDESEYFVTCQKSNELRILQTSNDSLLTAIQLGPGSFPQEIAVDSVHHLLYVSCQEGPAINGWKGGIAIINYQNNTLVKILTQGLYQPHGMAVDEDKQRVYVASLDYSTTGPAPHHVGSCGGRNGYVNIIDMNTQDFLPGYKNEVLPFPYWVEYRH